MKLELKNISPYLPYGLKVKLSDGEIKEVVGLRDWIGWCIVYKSQYGEVNTPIRAIKPVLRSLSDLTKEIEHNGEKFVPEVLLNDNCKEHCLPEDWNAVLFIQKENILSVNYVVIQKLLEWHFDIFDLRSKNLCIYHEELS